MKYRLQIIGLFIVLVILPAIIFVWLILKLLQ
jgi:hypothetical protein